MQFSTAACSADGYTQWMFSENHKKIVFVAWAITVVLAAIAVDVTSVTNWAVVACMALIPPMVVRHFWQVPEPTMSESIRNARQ